MPQTLAEHPVLTPPPNPASPPDRPADDDRELALIWISAGRTADDTAAHFARLACRSPESVSVMDADRHARLVGAMAELEAAKQTPETARAALGMPEPVAA